MTNGKRDYKKELAREHSHKPNRVKERAARNKARAQAGLKVGDSRQADHIKPLTEGGSKKQSNVQIISKKANLHKEALRKKREAKK